MLNLENEVSELQITIGLYDDERNKTSKIMDIILSGSIKPKRTNKNGNQVFIGFTFNSFDFHNWDYDKDKVPRSTLSNSVETYQEPYCNVWFGEYKGKYWYFSETEGDINVILCKDEESMIKEAEESQTWFDKWVKS